MFYKIDKNGGYRERCIHVSEQSVDVPSYRNYDYKTQNYKLNLHVVIMKMKSKGVQIVFQNEWGDISRNTENWIELILLCKQ